MAINTEKISSVLKSKIKEYNIDLKLEEVGEVVTVGDGVAVCYGLENAFYGEFIEFESGITGMVLNLEETSVGIVLFGDVTKVYQGMAVKRTGRVMEVPVGDELLGRVVNPIGEPIDGKGPLNATKTSPIEKVASGVMSRKSVSRPLETGIKAIDTVVPIGKGQRELIIGDRKTGKSQIAIDTILNQKGKNVYCVYVAIGQKQSTVSNLTHKLALEGAMEYTTIVLAGASDLAPIQYLSPYSGVSIAEEWMNAGKDVLIVYDDLTKHASAYRTLSLLLRRPPGREAYPGDVFYLHSRLLERAAQLNDELGGGSITALPIIETQAGDISAYIPTNVISITDGQLFLQADMFNAGQKPAVDPGLSVSRVGGAAQLPIIKKLSGSIKLELAQFRELEAFTKFGSDLDENTTKVIEHGKRLMEILKQDANQPLTVPQESIILYAVNKQHLVDVDVEDIKQFEMDLYRFLDKNHQDVVKLINHENKLTDEVANALEKVVVEFKASIL
ncbi:MAG: F0F1 ATP synthase subunit alpha [Spiroplasma sp.]|nr:F0F1 ATP synthase subunit alpha [Mycoplasmatales bacterium]